MTDPRSDPLHAQRDADARAERTPDALGSAPTPLGAPQWADHVDQKISSLMILPEDGGDEGGRS